MVQRVIYEIESGADVEAQLAGLMAGLARVALRLGWRADPALEPGPVFSKATRAPGCDGLGARLSSAEASAEASPQPPGGGRVTAPLPAKGEAER